MQIKFNSTVHTCQTHGQVFTHWLLERTSESLLSTVRFLLDTRALMIQIGDNNAKYTAGQIHNTYNWFDHVCLETTQDNHGTDTKTVKIPLLYQQYNYTLIYCTRLWDKAKIPSGGVQLKQDDLFSPK